MNMILTGLRGVGKTVLLETLKPIAISEGWAWVGTDLSETSSLSEENIALRLLTDLSVFTSSIVISSRELQGMGFGGQKSMLHETLDFNLLQKIYNHTPGLVADKVKQVLETVWRFASQGKLKGIIFAYDEAQTMADRPAKDQYPLSLLLDVFQSIQRKGIPFMLLLTGLPTLYPKLVEARTFSERMFHVVFLDRLDNKASREAILTPIKSAKSTVSFDEKSVNTIVDISGGYPYFIQFICREVYDVFIQQLEAGQKASVPIQAIVQKLDTDFFSGRWARATDRQRELLGIIAQLPNSNSEFTVQELVDLSSKSISKPFGGSHANQMLVSLADAGLVYKNRHGKYSFAVPLLGKFILRQMEHADKKII